MSVVALTPRPGLTGMALTPRGSSVVTEPVDGEPLQFATAYPVEMWPVALTAAKLSGPPLAAPRNVRIDPGSGTQTIRLRGTFPNAASHSTADR